MLERFTDNARRVVKSARRLAGTDQWGDANPEAILLALLDERRNVSRHLLNAAGVDADALRGALVAGAASAGQSAREVVESAKQVSQELGHNYVGSEHLLLGLARMSEYPASLALNAAGASPDRMLEELRHLHNGPSVKGPSWAKRLGSTCRAVWLRVQGRASSDS